MEYYEDDFKVGKGNGIFKKSIKEKDDIEMKRREKSKMKLKKKLFRADSTQDRYESLIQEMEFEEKKKEKLKEREDQLEANGLIMDER